jgi:hypothetical protein
MHDLIARLCDTLAPALAARGRYAERRQRALERAATIPHADRAAVEAVINALLHQPVTSGDLLAILEMWAGDPRTATAAQMALADALMIEDDPPPIAASS